MISSLILNCLVFLILVCLLFSSYTDRGITQKGKWIVFGHTLKVSLITMMGFVPLLCAVYMGYNMQDKHKMPIHMEVLAYALCSLVVFIEYFFTHFLKLRGTKSLSQYIKSLYGAKASCYTTISSLFFIVILSLACLVGNGFFAKIIGWNPKLLICAIGALAILYRLNYPQLVDKFRMHPLHIAQITMGVIWIMWPGSGSENVQADKKLLITSLSLQDSGVPIMVMQGKYLLVSSLLTQMASYPLVRWMFSIATPMELDQGVYSMKKLLKHFGLYCFASCLITLVSLLAWAPIDGSAMGVSNFLTTSILVKSVCVLLLIASSVASLASLIDLGIKIVKKDTRNLVWGKVQQNRKFQAVAKYIVMALCIVIASGITISQTRKLVLFGIYLVSSCLVPFFLAIAIPESHTKAFFYSVTSSMVIGLFGGWLVYQGHWTIMENLASLLLVSIVCFIGGIIAEKRERYGIGGEHQISSRPLPWKALLKRPFSWLKHQANSYGREPKLLGFFAACYYSTKLIWSNGSDQSETSLLPIVLISALSLSIGLMIYNWVSAWKETYEGLIWLISLGYLLPFTQTFRFLYEIGNTFADLEWLLSIILLCLITNRKVFIWLSVVGSSLALLLCSWNIGSEAIIVHLAGKAVWLLGSAYVYGISCIWPYKQKDTTSLLNAKERSLLVNVFEVELKECFLKKRIADLRTLLAKSVQKKDDSTRLELALEDYTKLTQLSSDTARLIRLYEKYTYILLEILKHNSIATGNIAHKNIGNLMQALRLRISPVYNNNIYFDEASTDFEVKIFYELFYFVISALIENCFWYRDASEIRITWEAKTRRIYFKDNGKSITKPAKQALSILSLKKKICTDLAFLKMAAKLLHAELEFDIQVNNKRVQACIQFF